MTHKLLFMTSRLAHRGGTALAGLWLALLAGCVPITSNVVEPACQQIKGHQLVSAELFFGRSIGAEGHVSDGQWSGFLHDEIAPRFPDGLTVLSGSGQWRDLRSGQTIEEPSFVVRIMAPQTPQTLAHLTQIKAAYMHRFQQQSVGLAMTSVCASF